jgi:hypothetical protein
LPSPPFSAKKKLQNGDISLKTAEKPLNYQKNVLTIRKSSYLIEKANNYQKNHFSDRKMP